MLERHQEMVEAQKKYELESKIKEKEESVVRMQREKMARIEEKKIVEQKRREEKRTIIYSEKEEMEMDNLVKQRMFDEDLEKFNSKKREQWKVQNQVYQIRQQLQFKKSIMINELRDLRREYKMTKDRLSEEKMQELKSRFSNQTSLHNTNRVGAGSVNGSVSKAAESVSIRQSVQTLPTAATKPSVYKKVNLVANSKFNTVKKDKHQKLETVSKRSPRKN